MDENTVLYQKKWLHELETTDVVQCTGNLIEGDGAMCALGLGVYAALGDEEIVDTFGNQAAGALLGLSKKASIYVYSMNDGQSLYSLDRPFKSIRGEKAEPRDFRFIARWLEIYFALERMADADNDSAG
jgi:hypothetical protein